MALRADWHFADAEFETVERSSEYDPLSDPSYSAPMPPITLQTDQDELRAYLSALLHQEGVLFDREVTCPIKDNPEATCLACPVSAARDHSVPRGQLCRVGQEQERVLTVITAQQHGLGG